MHIWYNLNMKIDTEICFSEHEAFGSVLDREVIVFMNLLKENVLPHFV
jgi:hypothetical protein